MRCRFRMVSLSWILLIVGGWVTSVRADEREDMWRMMGSTVRSDDKGDVTWFFVVALLLVLTIYLFSRFHNRSVRPHRGARTRENAPAHSFSEQAAAMGFRPIEVTNLRRIARRLSGGMDPVSVLATGSGRQFLTADLQRRIRRRKKEVELLEGILKKLGARAGHHFHERSSVRVQADVAIWLVQRASEEDAGGDDDIDVDIAPISGRLVDLSEGGAAICADIELAAGDVIEFWSADTQFWIPPTRSGVVSTRQEGAELSISLHFLDPPLTEIRRVIQEIQRSERDDIEDLYSGTGSDNGQN